MDTAHTSCRRVVVVSDDCPVWCSKETLLPLFADVSLQVAMDSHPLPASHSTPPALPEIRLVLLGRKGAGKSAAGNTILEVGGFESGKPTEECVMKRADVTGRTLLVVDTPGWEWYYPLNSTSNWVRRENLRSVSLCPPGPHAVLLVVRACASVTEEYIREIEDRLGPLGRGVWEHTMVLFTRGDELGLVSMEQRLLTGGPALQKLLQMCGSRYHVVDNRSKGDGTQVKELIGKLEEMVERKDGCRYLVADGTALPGLEADRERRASERRKRQRQMEERVQRTTIRAVITSDGPQGSELDAHHSFSKATRRLPEVRLVLLGERETGKSSAGNAILGGADYFRAGAVTEECVCQEAEVATRLVRAVDTPGWEGGASGATPERVKREIVSCVSLCPPGPHALLLTLRVDALVKVGHVKEHLELLGEGAWRHTILLFTHGDQLREGVDIEQHILGGGRDLQWLLEKCRGRYHVVGGAGYCKVAELLQEVDKMAATNRCEAFSGLIHEVQDLTRKRNEKVDLRLKEMEEKMLRQKTELRKMREREMRSIRWFFDRKKKVKPSEKVEVGKGEEEERWRGERKNDVGDIEERMRFLSEDKEREIQDLSVEKERMRLALNQSRGERDKVMFHLEVKDRENEELKEKVEEQQRKLLELERSSLENERMKEEEWVSEEKKLKEDIERLKKDKEEWMEKCDSIKREMDEIRKREVAEMDGRRKTEMKIELLEKEEEMEDIKMKASEGKSVERRGEEIKSQQEKEMERKRHEKEVERMTGKIRKIENMMEEMKSGHEEEMAQKLKENVEDREKIRKHHEEEKRSFQREKLRQIEELQRQFAKETEERMQAQKKEVEELEQRFLIQLEEERLKNAEERERILQNLNEDMARKMSEKERELKGLKLQHGEVMAEKMKEMEKQKEEIQAEVQKEIKRKAEEKEKDVERVQREFRDKVRDVQQEREKEVKELKQRFAEEKQKHVKERQKMLGELERNYVTQIKERALQNDKEKKCMEKEHEKCISQKLQETERMIEGIKHQHVNEVKEKKREHDEEKERIHTNLRKEMEQRLGEKEEEIKRIKLDVKEMKGKIQQMENKENEYLKSQKNMEQRIEEREREIQVMKDQLHETEGREGEKRLQKKDEEVNELRQRNAENEKELLQTRLVIEQTKTELKELTRKMEKEMMSMIEEYENEIAGRERSAEAVVDEKDRAFRCLEEESRKRIVEVTEKYEESRRRVDLLQKRNEDMRKEAADAAAKYEELKEKSEGEVRKQREGYEQQGKSREAELQGVLRERDAEVRLLKEANGKLKEEVAVLKERQSKGGVNEEEIEKVFSMRSRGGGVPVSKEKELPGRDVNRKYERIDCHTDQENYRKRRDDKHKGDENMRQSETQERERETLLKVLESKAKESNSQGKDRQEKVRRREDRDEVHGNMRVHESHSAGESSKDSMTQEEQSKEEKRRGNVKEWVDEGMIKEQLISSGEHKTLKEIEKKTKDGDGPAKPEVSLRVVVLGESWSSRSPAGASILGGDSSEDGGSSFRHWKARIEGQRLSIVEPLDLRWRDGPGKMNATHRRSILESISWSHPGPDIVLLVFPAFLNCTQKYRRAVEEHMGLFGEDAWQRTMLLLTWGEVLGESVEQHILRNGELVQLVERCGGRYYMVTSKKSNAMTEGLFKKMGDMLALNRVDLC